MNAVESLIACLRDENLGIRTNAAMALGNIGDTRAVEPLIESLNDHDEVMRSRASSALEEITGQDFGQDASLWLDWWHQQARSVGGSKL